MPLHTEPSPWSQNPYFKVGHGPKSCLFSPVLLLEVQAIGEGEAGGCKLINTLSFESSQSVVLPNHDLNRAVFRHRHRIILSTPNCRSGLPQRLPSYWVPTRLTRLYRLESKGKGVELQGRTQKLK